MHRLGLFLRCDSEPVVGLGPISVLQLGQVVAKGVVVQPDLGPALVESLVAADDFLEGHCPVVDQPKLDGLIDRYECRVDHHCVVSFFGEVRPDLQ